VINGLENIVFDGFGNGYVIWKRHVFLYLYVFLLNIYGDVFMATSLMVYREYLKHVNQNGLPSMTNADR
jgi:hypothetical protein